jgi:hypothetical protein
MASPPRAARPSATPRPSTCLTPRSSCAAATTSAPSTQQRAQPTTRARCTASTPARASRSKATSTPKRVDLWGIAYAALADDAAGNTGEGLYGALAEAAFRVHERVEIGMRYSAVVVPERLRADARATADRANRRGARGRSREARREVRGRRCDDALQEATAGFAVYIFGHDLKWHSDVSWLHDSKSTGDTDAFRLRTQLQLGF